MVGLIGHRALRLGALGLVLAGCSGHTAGSPTQTSGGAAGSATGAGGTTTVPVATAGAASGGVAPTGGVANAGTDSGGSSSGGAPGGGATTAGTSSAGMAGGVVGGQAGTPNLPDGGAGGASPVIDPNAILKVKPSPGCGKDATQDTGVFVKYTIATSGTKDANCADHLNGVAKCGEWSLARDYYLWLPPNYSKTKAYPLVLEGPGCGGTGLNVYSLSPTNGDADAGVNGTVIRVGLTPAPNSIGHGTNENQGCFDDKEGDDSVDLVFYERLLDKLKLELCYDENRVFVAGNSSGAWIANELACKYAGDTNGHAIRGVVVNAGGLPTEPKFVPTCSDKPLAGLWVYEVGETTDTFSGSKVAVNRAMVVDKCPNFGVDGAAGQDFPIGGGNAASTCKRLTGCLDDNYPLVVCALAGSAHGSHEPIYNPAAATFLQLLSAP